MNYFTKYRYRNSSIKLPTFSKLKMVYFSKRYLKSHSISPIVLKAKLLNQPPVIPRGHRVNVHTSTLDGCLLIELKEKVHGQKISVFIFTLSGVLLKRTNVKKLVTIIYMPFTFSKDYLMNVQIDDTIYTWRISRN